MMRRGKITSLVNISDPAPHVRDAVHRPPSFRTQALAAAQVLGPYYSNPTLRNFEPRVGFCPGTPFRKRPKTLSPGGGLWYL